MEVDSSPIYSYALSLAQDWLYMIKLLFAFLFNSLKTRTQLQLEVLYLSKQLDILKRNSPKVQIKNNERLFFCMLKKYLPTWRQKTIIVRPETVIRWHRNAFRYYWKWISNPQNGRPKIEREIISLIKRTAQENPLWGVPRIHGELIKIGVKISQSTVQRYLPKKNRKPTGQSWKTFLKNHSTGIIAIDFLTVPTINFKLLHVLVIIEHGRRKLLHFNVTTNPNAAWILQQIRNLLFEGWAPKYLIRDRDKRYGLVFSNGLKNLGIKQVITAYRSPWQNGYVERVIGSIKRECLDNVIVINETHLRTILTEYISYYNKYRTHIGINKDSPEGRAIQSDGDIESIPILNGLHHVYFRRAA